MTARKPNRPGTLSPSRDREPLTDKGGALLCARCLRVRLFGIRCECERQEL